MKANFVSQIRVLTVLLVTTFSLSSFAEGTHGGDGRMMHNKVYASVDFLNNMQKSLKNYVENLRAKKRFLDSEWENSEFAILISDEFLADIEQTPPYVLQRKRGACGHFVDGFPRTASTQTGVPHAPICVDVMTAQDLGLTASQLAGIIGHEHIRHLPKNLSPGYLNSKTNIDTFHNYANVIAATYWDVQTQSANGRCFLMRSGSLGGVDVTELVFNSADLLLSGKPVSKLLLDKNVSIGAAFEKDQYGRVKILVTITYDGKKFEKRVPIHSDGTPTVYWRQADFDLDWMPLNTKTLGRETTLSCSTYTRSNALYRGSRTSTSMERDWSLKTNPETNEVEFTGWSKTGIDQ